MTDKPKKGAYDTAREVVHDDYRDVNRYEGGVVGEPQGKDDYYTTLSPYDASKPFQGHIHDPTVVSDNTLTPAQKANTYPQ